jgi:ribosomal protein S6--L-glutamate ligase
MIQTSVVHNSPRLPIATATEISVIVERRYMSQAQPGGLIKALMKCACDVDVIETDAIALSTVDSLFSSENVVVARGRDWPTFSLLRAAELAGATVINACSAISSVYDKARMAVELAAAGIPTPKTWIGSGHQIAASLHSEDMPLVVKPVHGDNGAGIRVARSWEELTAISGPVLVQQYIQNDGFDLKLYCIGNSTWLVRKPGSCAAFGQSRNEMPELLRLTREFSEIADRCRLCFGLELFGVDCLDTPDGPVVIEVNEFPNYSGIPHANELLAEYVCSRIPEGDRQ